MRRAIRGAFGIAVATLCSACHHATINTGLTAGTEVVTNEWAHSYLLGLVPPAAVDVAGKCKNGIARVETQVTFVNALVTVMTLGVYTPVQVDVTCASGARASLGPSAIWATDPSPAALRRAIAAAADASRKRRQPVLVAF